MTTGDELRPLGRDEVRAIDREAADRLGLPTLVLMENAGRGAAEFLRERAGGGPCRVVVLCGPGNNGGDGAVVARHLDAWGWPVRVVWTAPADRLRGDPAVQRGILEKAGIAQEHDDGSIDPAAAIAGADRVVDGLLGTGLTRAVEGRLREWIEAVNASGRPALALDLPSGLDCETGGPLGAGGPGGRDGDLRGPEAGLRRARGADYLGAVRVVEIGVPGCLLAPFRRPASGGRP